MDLTNGSLVEELPNNTASGATLNKLVCVTNVSGTPMSQTCATGATKWSGVAVGGATGATAGNTLVARVGQVSLVFDNATTIGDYAVIGSSGQAHDTGSSVYPASGQLVGSVRSVNTGAGTTALVNLYNPGLQAQAGGLAQYISSMPQSSVNLFDTTKATLGQYFNGITGSVTSSSGWFTTGQIPVVPGGTVTANFAIGSTVVGYAWYGANGEFIPGANGVTAANTPIAVPANALFFKAGAAGSIPSNAMIVNGSAIPATYSPFTLPTQSATLASAQGNSALALYNSMSLSRNLFNTNAAVASTCLSGNGVSYTQSGYHISAYIPVQPSLTYRLDKAMGGNSSLKTAFYDQSLGFVAYGPDLSQPAGTTFTAPAGGYFYRLCEADSVQATQMMTIGTTAPSQYIPFDPVATTVATTGVTSATQNALYSSLPTARNLYDLSRATLDYYIAGSTGNPVSFSGFSYSDYIPTIPGTTYTMYQADGGSAAAGGGAWYDGTKTYLSAGPTLGLAACATFTAPSNGYFLRFSEVTSVNSTQMITIGATCPTSYIAFGWGGSGGGSTTEASLSQWNGKHCLFDGDSITHFYFTYWGPPITSRTGCTVPSNYANARGGRQAPQQQEYYGGFIPYPSLNCSMTSYSIDASNNLTLTGSCPSALPAGTTFWIYGGTSTVTVSGISTKLGGLLTSLLCSVTTGTTSSIVATCTYGGTAWTAYPSISSTSDTLTVVPTLANGTISSCTWTNSTQTVTLGGTFPAGYAVGMKFGVSGATACGFLTSVPNSGNPTGGLATASIICTATSVSTSSVSGTCTSNNGTISQADVATTGDSGTLISPGHNLKCLWIDATHNWCNAGTAGNTWAQDFVAATPDEFVVGLGTNDGSVTAGSTSSTPGDGSESGSALAIAQFAFRAKPTVRIYWWVPYLQNSATVGTTIKNMLNTIGVPVIDPRIGTPMDNLMTWYTYLQTDHTHPNATGGTVLGNFLTDQFKSLY
jgi:hypothetical protein